MSIDWLGVANVIQQIGKMAEPDAVDTLKAESEVRKAELEHSEEIREKRLKKQREFDVLSSVVNDIHRRYVEADAEVDALQEGFDQVGFDLGKIKPVNQSYNDDNQVGYGKGVEKIIGDLDISSISGLREYKGRLEEELSQVLCAKIRTQEIQNNIEYGKKLFNKGMFTKDIVDKRKFLVRYVDDPDNPGTFKEEKYENPNFDEKVSPFSFDRGSIDTRQYLDKDGTMENLNYGLQMDDANTIIDYEEYALALGDVIDIHKKAGFGVDGIAEGFWGEYDQKSQGQYEVNQRRAIKAMAGDGIYDSDGQLTEEGRQLAVKQYSKRQNLTDLERNGKIEEAVNFIKRLSDPNVDIMGVKSRDKFTNKITAFEAGDAGKELRDQYMEAQGLLLSEDMLHLVNDLNTTDPSIKTGVNKYWDLGSDAEASASLSLQRSMTGHKWGQTEKKAYGGTGSVLTQAGFTKEFYKLLKDGSINFEGNNINFYPQQGVALGPDGEPLKDKKRVFTHGLDDADFQINMAFKKQFEYVVTNWDKFSKYIDYETREIEKNGVKSQSMFNPDSGQLYGLKWKSGAPFSPAEKDKFMNYFTEVYWLASQRAEVNFRRYDDDSESWVNK